MRQKVFWIAASCILAVVGLLPLASSGATPASKEKVIYSFAGGTDGANPFSNLVADATGNLYGTTYFGGSPNCVGGCGTVFELIHTKGGWQHQVLYSFAGGTDGANPSAGMVFDKGSIYGTTSQGGDTSCSHGCGTVFELTQTKVGWKEQVIYIFTGGSDGTDPRGSVVFDDMGNLHGTALYGGFYGGKGRCSSGCGTVFELTHQAGGAWTETTMYAFTDSSDGAFPSSVVLDPAGNAYGMAFAGGSTGSCTHLGGCGVIYKLTPDSDGGWTESVPYTFGQGGGFGIDPSGGLLLGEAGHLFGTCSRGGDGYGMVFELHDSQKNGWKQSNLHIFYGNPDGVNPEGGLVADSLGNLFGVTTQGGAETGCYLGCGMVFELKRSQFGWRETILHSFGGTGDGAGPEAALILDSNGNLYGTTVQGGIGCGSYGCGTVYEITP